MVMKTYPGSGDGLDGLLLAHFLHGGVVLLLVLRHEHLQRPACVHQGKHLLTAMQAGGLQRDVVYLG